MTMSLTVLTLLFFASSDDAQGGLAKSIVGRHFGRIWGPGKTEFYDYLIKAEKAGLMSGARGNSFSWTLVQTLRDDDVKWNADLSLATLSYLWPRSQEALEDELRVGDAQSIRYAGRVLRWKSERPSPLLLSRTVEEMRDDSGLGLHMYDWMWNSRECARYLQEWYPIARPYVLREIKDGDCQSRPLAAAIAGFAGDSEAAEQIVETLVVHLKDNDHWGDAQMALPALYRLGRSGIPHLSKYANSKDRQQRILVNLILERIENPSLKWFESSVAIHGVDFRISETSHESILASFEEAIEQWGCNEK
jgi:hypothetical protein